MRPVGSTLTRPRSGDPDGPAGMNRPSSARSTWSISAAVPARRGTTSVAANRSTAATSGVVGEPVGGIGIPAGGLQRRDQLPGRGLGLVDRRPFVGAVLGQTERLPQAGQDVLAAEQLAGPQDGQHQVEFGLPRWLLPQDVQPVADLDVLDLAQPAVDVQQHVVERVLGGPFGQPEVVVHLGGPDQRPDLLADGGQLAGIQRGDVGVLVEQLLQTRDVAVGFGARHRRDEVVDEHGVRAPLGLGALAGVVDQERVDQRQVAQRGVGSARRRHAQRLAGQPFQVAVLAQVHHRVRPESGVQPVVGGQVVVAGRQVRVVVDGDRIFPEAARRLHHQHQVAGLHCGDDDLAVGIVAAVDEQLTRRRAPVRLHGVGEFARAGWRTTRGSPWRTPGSGCRPAGPR